MSSRRKGRPTVNVSSRLRLAVVAVLAVPLSACTVNFDAQTDQQYNPTEGVYDRDGEVDVLNALVVSGEDGSGRVIAGLSNENQDRGDTLTGVTGAGDDSDVTVQAPSGGEEIAPGGFLNLTTTPDPITVQGDVVSPGGYVELTFTFQNAEAVTLDVPVVSHSGDYADVQLGE